MTLKEITNLVINAQVFIEVREYGKNFRFTGRTWGISEIPAEKLNAEVLAIVPKPDVLQIEIR